MTLPTSGAITARQIADTFGYTLGASKGTRIGDYQIEGGQKFVGGTEQLPIEITLPISDGIPVTGPIKFSDFYGKRPTYVVDYYSGGAEAPTTDAYTRFKNNSKVIIGGVVGPKNNANDTSGRRVIILVNKDIFSNNNVDTHCALKTGDGWSSDTQLEILVGFNGEILGAGGAGGGAGSSGGGGGGAGGSGSSGLGVQYEGTGGTRVIIQSGGRIAGGGGGGGGGGGARAEREERWRGPRRGVSGGAGGQGAGYNQSATGGGEGGTSDEVSSLTVVGGDGGSGGSFGQAGGAGGGGSASGNLEWSNTGGGGAGGAAGAAIRRSNSSITLDISNLGPLSQIVGADDALGIT